MQQINYSDIPQDVIDKIKQKASILYEGDNDYIHEMIYERFKMKLLACFTDNNNNFIFCNDTTDFSGELVYFNGGNIKNSIIIIQRYSTSIESINITDSFIFCDDLTFTKNSKIINCEIISNYGITLKNSTIKNSIITASMSSIDVISSNIDNSNIKSTSLSIYECNIDNLTLVKTTGENLSYFNIKNCNFNNTQIARKYASEYFVDINNVNLNECLVCFSNSVKLKDITLDKSVIHNDFNITGDIKNLTDDISGILLKSDIDVEKDVNIKIYIQENKFLVYKDGDVIGLFDYKISDNIKKMTNKNRIEIRLNFPHDDSVNDIISVSTYLITDIFHNNDREADTLKNILSYKDTVYVYNTDGIKEYKNFKFKQTIKQDIIDDAVANRRDYDCYIIRKSVYVIEKSNYNVKRNAFMIGEISEVLSFDGILYLTYLTLDDIVEMFNQLKIYDLKKFNFVQQGQFNIQSNDQFIPPSDSYLIFNGGNIFITSKVFYQILSNNLDNINSFINTQIKNLYDYKKYVKLLGNYEKTSVSFNSRAIKELDFSHNYDYILTDNYIFIIWNVRPQNITIIHQ